jgi:hypothetical protein
LKYYFDIPDTTNGESICQYTKPIIFTIVPTSGATPITRTIYHDIYNNLDGHYTVDPENVTKSNRYYFNFTITDELKSYGSFKSNIEIKAKYSNGWTCETIQNWILHPDWVITL